MAFSIRRLSVLAYANGFTLWHYKGAGDGLSDAAAPGFFNEAADMLAPGDMLMVSGSQGARMLAVAKAQAGQAVILAPMC